jgi:hypothetical protein
LVLASRLPLFILDQWVKGQNGNLVGKNGFWSITTHGPLALKLHRCIVLASRWPLLIFGSGGQRLRSHWPCMLKQYRINNLTTHGPLTSKHHKCIDFGQKMISMDLLGSRGQRSRSHWLYR